MSCRSSLVAILLAGTAALAINFYAYYVLGWLRTPDFFGSAQDKFLSFVLGVSALVVSLICIKHQHKEKENSKQGNRNREENDE